MEKVVVAMSGGVDSSVAAALLKEEGYQVIGVTMQIWPSDRNAGVDRFGGCCGTGAIEDARKVAYKLGIPHYVMNFREIFAREVIDDFCQEYRQGRTPNPCIRCNQYIKFGALLEKARGLGADLFATGHHARIERDENTGKYLLKKGVDRRKDQSYFLYPLTQSQLSRTLLPVGNLTKEKVREIAEEMALPVAAKPESQEICFIPDNDYAAFLTDYIPGAARPGIILNERGDTLGSHRGIIFYTVGQRKGLGISGKEPFYVTAIEAERNAVIAGTKGQASGDELIANSLNWILVDTLTQPLATRAKIRYRHQEAEAIVTTLDKEQVQVKFKEPQFAITPGQAIVFYDKETVVGGGIIERAGKQSPIKTLCACGKVEAEKEVV